jgi:hypothetical protein
MLFVLVCVPLECSKACAVTDAPGRITSAVVNGVSGAGGTPLTRSDD